MIKKQIIKYTTTLLMAFSVLSCATNPSSSTSNEHAREVLHEVSKSDVSTSRYPQMGRKVGFFVSENKFNQLHSQTINHWPSDIYAEDNEGGKVYLNRNKDNTYSIGFTTWKTIPLTAEYVLLVSQNKDLINNLHYAKIIRFNDNGFEQFVIEPEIWYILSKTKQLNWRIQEDLALEEEGEKEINFLFEDSFDGLKKQLTSYLNEGYKLVGFNILQLLSQAKSDRYKTYLSYFQPAYHANELFRLAHQGQGMTHTQINNVIHGQILPAFSAFYNRYSTNQEFSDELYFQETLNIYDSLQKGGDRVLLELQNKVLRNAITQQIVKQQDYTVLSDDYSELVRAVNAKDMKRIKKVLQETADINEHYKNWSAAHQAAQDGSLEILRLLVDNGADIKVRTETKTPLLSSVSGNRKNKAGNYINIANYLIGEGADVNARIATNLLSPLIYAAKNNQTEMVSLLLENDAELWAEDYAGSSAWEWASHKNNKQVIEIFERFNAKGGFAAYDAIKAGNLMQFKREVNKMTNIYQLSPNDDSSSLLSEASAEGQLGMVKYLIGQGFNINFDANLGVTGAYLAAKNNQLEVLTFLAEHGADLQKQSYYAPIHTAAFRGHMNIVKFLLKQKYMDPLLASNSTKSTALHSAIEGNHADMVALLLQQPAYYNAQVINANETGDSPLIFLFKNKHDNRRIFEMLMEQPWTNIKQKNNEGKTAYDYAEEAGFYEYLNEL